MFAFCIGFGISALVSGAYSDGCGFLIVGILLATGWALLVRWLSKKSYPAASGEGDPFHTAVVGLTGLVPLVLFLAVPDVYYDCFFWLVPVSFFAVSVLGIWLLVRCKRFLWRNYAVVGFATAAVVLCHEAPSMRTWLGEAWATDHEGTFRSLIDKVQSADVGNSQKLHRVVSREIDPQFLRGAESPLIVLLAEGAEKHRESRLRLSPICGVLPRHLVAESPHQVRTVVIHGEPALLEHGMDVESPVLVYSWPDGKLLSSGRLYLGDASWGLSPGEAYAKLAHEIKAAASTGQ